MIENNSKLLDIYFYEIIGAIVILILFSIMFFLRKKKDTSTEPHEIEEVIVENEIKESTDTVSPNKIETDNFDGKEEGTFSSANETQTIKPTIKPTVSSITKRDVPPHGKITKQNFKEFSGLRLLVAEDNLINQKVITGLLAGTGIDIVIADDGQEALDILQKDKNFNMIIMDVHMPRMNGFEATRAIKSDPNLNHFVVVALSGDTAVDDVKKTKDAGMQEHLEKPLRMDSLYDVLYAYTGQEQSSNSEYIKVIQTKELNGDKGLEICGGDEEFYYEILHEFINTYENSTNQLHDLLIEEKLKEADKLLLDLTGITANIGADNLNKIATDIREALKDTQEKSYFTLLGQYKEHIEELIKDIKEYK